LLGRGERSYRVSPSNHITGKDEAARAAQRLVRSNFGAQTSKRIENHTSDSDCPRRSSCSVLAFVGSPELSLSLHQHKISNDMLTAITGNKRYQMEYVSESDGAAAER
jgi:hypothetical protein